MKQKAPVNLLSGKSSLFSFSIFLKPVSSGPMPSADKDGAIILTLTSKNKPGKEKRTCS